MQTNNNFDKEITLNESAIEQASISYSSVGKDTRTLFESPPQINPVERAQNDSSMLKGDDIEPE